MESESSQVTPPKRKRRWFQYRLRTLMIVVAIVAVAAAIVSRLPNELTRQQLHSIKPGMSADQVRELVGRPDSVRQNDDGSVDWEYGGFWPDWVQFKNWRVVSAERF